MFKRATGGPKVEWYPKTASTAFTNGMAVKSTSGQLVAAVANEVVGIILTDIASTDSDYAVARKVPVDIWTPEDIFEADVITGTLTTAMVNTKVDLASGALGIDVTGTTNKTCLIVGFISTTKALVKIVGSTTNDVS